MAKPIVFKGENVIRRSGMVRSYVNPSAYDPTPPPPRDEFKISPRIFKIGLIVILVVLLLYTLFLSPLFRIKQIQIKGEARQETIDTIKSLVGKNIFLIGGKRAEDSLAKKQPGIKEIKVLRGLPNSIIVELVERDPAAIWETQGKKYLLDKDSVVYKEINSSDPIEGEPENGYPKIIDQKNLPVELGGSVSSNALVTFIRRLYLDLPKNGDLIPEQVYVPETTFQIEVVTKDGPRLKIDTSRDLDEQLTDIKFILDNKKDSAKQLIDVRIPGFAYIK